MRALWFAVGLAVPVAVVAFLLGTRSPDPQGAHVDGFTLTSRLVGRDLHEIAIRPAGAGPGRPLLVLLHGRGSSPSAFLGQGLFGALKALGPRAPEVLLADGDDASYWHDRREGAWGSSLVREAIPAAVARLPADRRRVAIGGESMGGFGALDLARLHPRRFCAVGGHSAALWRTGGETPGGAFDDAADFARHDVMGSPFRYRGPLWIDVGADDPFRSADESFARAHGAILHVWPGGHEGSYWRAHMLEYLRFYARALARCGRG
ncbi:MAG TPA: alpha/beta hydrolase-fold protein [Gaiellaceae bacterium]